MTWIARRLGVAATILLGAGVTVGCGGGAANAAPPVTAASASTSADEEDDAAAGLLEHHRYHHHGGVALFIAMSLDTLGVSPEERAAVEKIRADLHVRMDPARIAGQNLATTLADGLAAPTFDAEKVDAAVAQVTAAAAAVNDACADALNKLHAVLTVPERAALVDKVESHWAVWQDANAEESGPAKSESGRLAALVTDLGLTSDQVDKVRAGLGESVKRARLDPQEMATHLREFGNAFRSEKFDARVLTTANGANAQLAGSGASRVAHLVQTVSRVLTAEQRTKLAQMLREHAAHNPSAEVTP